MVLLNPMKALMATNTTFDQLTDNGKIDVLLPKLMYIALNIACLGMGIYKMGTMGLLPLNSADWISLLEVQIPAEITNNEY